MKDEILNKLNEIVQGIDRICNPGPELVDITGVSTMLNISVTAARRMDRSGSLPKPIKINKSKRWWITELKKWVSEACPPRNQWNRIKGSIDFE